METRYTDNFYQGSSPCFYVGWDVPVLARSAADSADSPTATRPEPETRSWNTRILATRGELAFTDTEHVLAHLLLSPDCIRPARICAASLGDDTPGHLPARGGRVLSHVAIAWHAYDSRAYKDAPWHSTGPFSLHAVPGRSEICLSCAVVEGVSVPRRGRRLPGFRHGHGLANAEVLRVR